jgi:hypothetical protein
MGPQAARSQRMCVLGRPSSGERVGPNPSDKRAHTEGVAVANFAVTSLVVRLATSGDHITLLACRVRGCVPVTGAGFGRRRKRLSLTSPFHMFLRPLRSSSTLCGVASMSPCEMVSCKRWSVDTASMRYVGPMAIGIDSSATRGSFRPGCGSDRRRCGEGLSGTRVEESGSKADPKLAATP